MANDKRFIVKSGLSGPNVRFANGSNTTAVLDFNYGTDGTLKVVGNTTLGTLITINDSAVPGTSGVLTVNGDIYFGSSAVSINSTFYEATANNASYLNGKQESQLYVANAVFATTAGSVLGGGVSGTVANATFATTANNSNFAFGKQESQLSVAAAANATFATTANNSNFAFGKQESQLSVALAANATFATTSNNSNFAFGKQEAQLSVSAANNASYLSGYTWSAPATIGGTVANTGTFTTLSANTIIVNNQLNVPSGVVEMAINYGGPASTNTTFYAGANSGTVYAKIGSFGLNVVAGSISGSGAGLTGTGTNFTANNATFANSASFVYGKQESQLSVANAVYAQSAGSIAGGNVSGTVANANNSNFLNGANSQFFTNATNISTGTLAEPRLPFRMDQNLRTTDNVTHANGTFTGTVSIGGDLILTGNLYSQNVQSLSVADPLIKLGGNNYSDVLWSGFVTHYGPNNHTGLVRSPTTKEYILMSSFTDEASVNNNIIVPSDGSFTYANLQVNFLKIGNSSVTANLSSTNYSGTANNATYAYGKQESQLSVALAANATFATTSNNSNYAYGKQESQLVVANAAFATTANNSNYAYGKQESQLVVANAAFATTANNSNFAFGKQETQLSVSAANTATYLQNRTWEAAGAIGSTVANTGAFTTLITSGITTHNANVVINAALIANSSSGIAGQVLSSNGTSIYWTNANNISGTVSNANNASYLNNKQESQLSVNSATYATFANNSTYAYGKQESQLSVALAANATFATTANNSNYAFGKQESQLVVANAVFATTANNALSAYGKQESQLSVAAAANATFATTSNNSNFAYGKQESQLTVANSAALQGATWQSPLAIGSVTPTTANFTIANTTNYLSVKSIAHLSGDSNTTTAVAQVQISAFNANTYGSAKIYVQATEASTNVRQVTELLIVHNNVTASATEYGMLFTGTTALATYEVDILSNNVRLLAIPASANTISFRVSEHLFLQ